jgi:hypothetical protein
VGRAKKVEAAETRTAPERLAEYLRDHNLSGQTASKIFACVPSFISMLLAGKATPGLELAAHIEDVTGIECRAWVARK